MTGIADQHPSKRQLMDTNQNPTTDMATKRAKPGTLPGQIVLVLQGGGALGAYQVGVYQAMHEAGIEPDWVIGTSIGAINACLIAGNPPERRLERLEEFWRRVTHPRHAQLAAAVPFVGPWTANMMTIAGGLSGFFAPNPLALMGLAPLG